MDNECASCFYFTNDGRDDGSGLCRRYAPRPISDDLVKLGNHPITWPEVEVDDWCGEFKAPAKGS